MLTLKLGLRTAYLKKMELLNVWWRRNFLGEAPSMVGFSELFKESERYYQPGKDFSKFREDEKTYHFVLCNCEADENALKVAAQEDSALLKKYMAKNRHKSRLGYGNVPFRVMDACDSRHIMMSTIIFSYLPKLNRIVEIGGGYGNWLRLNEGIAKYKKWTIIDLPFVLDLSRWYLQKTLKRFDKVEFISAYEYPSMENIDLVIGAHSVSELAMDDFLQYYQKVILNAKYFFYATHLTNCGPELLAKKLAIISQDFVPIKTRITEEGSVHNILYRRK